MKNGNQQLPTSADRVASRHGRGPLRRPEKETRPFQQGYLDGLCGVYAIINATRAATQPYARLNTSDWIDLFHVLILEAEERSALADTITDGVRYHLMSQLLHTTSQWVGDGWELTMKHRKPFHRRLNTPLSEVIDCISEHLSETGTSAIFATEGRWSHYTAVKRITPRSIILNDSGGLRHFRLQSCDTRPTETSGRSLRIFPTCVYLLRVS